MKSNPKQSQSHHVLRRAVLALVTLAAPFASAATVWTGPPITFTRPSGGDPTLPANQDRITPNVWLTRGDIQGLYNARTETNFTHDLSPADTAWANGVIADYASLSYTDWNTWAKTVNGGALHTIGKDAVVHLISEDIFIGIKFLAWDAGGGGGFTYTRSTGQASPPSPTVSITNPPSGAVFAAPASLQIQATAAVTGGSVTNVAFFGNGVLLGSDQNSPFGITTDALPAASYALTAVATAAGVSTTSSVVNVTVVSPVPISVTSPRLNNGQFSFDFSADLGLSYLIQNSSNLMDWVSVLTNVAASNPVHFAEGFLPAVNRYYRVGRQPNP